MRRFPKLGQEGQTAMEYMLILVVAITIGIAFKQKMEEFLLDNPNSFVTRSINGLKSKFQSDSSGRFKKFPMQAQ